MAGPCAVEGEEQVRTVARAVHAAGAGSFGEARSSRGHPPTRFKVSGSPV